MGSGFQQASKRGTLATAILIVVSKSLSCCYRVKVTSLHVSRVVKPAKFPPLLSNGSMYLEYAPSFSNSIYSQCHNKILKRLGVPSPTSDHFETDLVFLTFTHP